MRIVTLLARHGTEYYANAAGIVKAWFTQLLPGVQHHMVMIDTALEDGHEEQLAAHTVLIGSSNAHWEFSAWDRAIAYLDSSLDEFDLVHLATSAFGALDTSHLDDFSAEMLANIRRRSCAVGAIDYRSEPVVVYGTSSQAWLRSSWIFVPSNELRRLGSLASVTDVSQLFSGDAATPFRLDAPISTNYQQFILHYLTGTRRGLEWHSHFELNPETLPRFEAKAKAILNEHLLSIRLRLQGCALVDATWLARRHAQWPSLPLECVPSWQYQISARKLIARKRPSRNERATLVVGESFDIAERHGFSAGRDVLLRAVARDPALVSTRPVLGALRRVAW